MDIVLILIVVLETIGLVVLALHKSGAEYIGDINVLEGEEKKTYSLDVYGDAEDIEKHESVRFRVKTSGRE